MNKFPERFKELLATKAVSQREFGRQCKLDSKTVSNWCNGKTEPNINQIIMICKYFGESADYLLGLKDD